MYNLTYLQDDSNVPGWDETMDETMIDMKKSIEHDKTRRERMRKIEK